MNQIQSELQEIFRRVFDDEMVITETTSAADVDGWDSIAHINLIIAIEKHFAIKFTAGEIAALGRRGQNVGGMLRILAVKTGRGVGE
jgi:acyl carrier protein